MDRYSGYYTHLDFLVPKYTLERWIPLLSSACFYREKKLNDRNDAKDEANEDDFKRSE